MRVPIIELKQLQCLCYLCLLETAVKLFGCDALKSQTKRAMTYLRRTNCNCAMTTSDDREHSIYILYGKRICLRFKKERLK